MGNVAHEIAKYRGDPLLFAKDFGLGGSFPEFQKALMRDLGTSMSISPISFYAHPLNEAEMQQRLLKMQITFDGSFMMDYIARAIETYSVPASMLGYRRKSRGWRRHIRRMKAEKPR